MPAQNNQRHYTIVNKLGPPSVFGDALYNCSQVAPAESDAGDERRAHGDVESHREGVAEDQRGDCPASRESPPRSPPFSTAIQHHSSSTVHDTALVCRVPARLEGMDDDAGHER